MIHFLIRERELDDANSKIAQYHNVFEEMKIHISSFEKRSSIFEKELIIARVHTLIERDSSKFVPSLVGFFQ